MAAAAVAFCCRRKEAASDHRCHALLSRVLCFLFLLSSAYVITLARRLLRKFLLPPLPFVVWYTDPLPASVRSLDVNYIASSAQKAMASHGSTSHSASSFSSSSSSSSSSGVSSSLLTLQFELFLDAKGALTHLLRADWQRFSRLLDEFFHQPDRNTRADGITANSSCAPPEAKRRRRFRDGEFVPSRRPTFLIGNGWTMAATTESSSHSESWDRVVDEIVEKLYDSSVLENCNPVQKAELIAQAGELQKLKRNLAVKVRPPPTVAHHFLSYLLHSHGGGHVVTTNYDCVLDNAMHDQLVQPPRRTVRADGSLPATTTTAATATSAAPDASRPVPIFISVLDAVPVGPSFTMDQAHLHPPLEFGSGHVMLHRMHGSFHDFKATSIDNEAYFAAPATTTTTTATGAAAASTTPATTATTARIDGATISAAASAASSDYYSRPGLSNHIVISESEYRAALQRLITSTASSSVLFACSTSLLIVMGKGMVRIMPWIHTAHCTSHIPCIVWRRIYT